MVSPVLSASPVQQFTINGVPLSGGKLFTYAAGTTTKQATYTDATGSTQNTNPIIINSNGQPQNGSGQPCGIWLDPSLSYKFVLSPSNDTDPPTNPYWAVDNISPTNIPAALAQSSGAGLVGYSESTAYTAGTVGAALKAFINVKNAPYNAKGDGVTDDATAIVAAVAALKAAGGGILYFPPGTYYLNTLQTSPWPTFFLNCGVLFNAMSDFKVVGPGATLTMGNAANASEILFFNNCFDFEVVGLTLKGNRTGLASTTENVAIAVVSCYNFHIHQIHLTSNWGGEGAGIAGNYLANGVFENIVMDAVGIGFDVAQMVNCAIRKVRMTGADNTGATTSAHAGDRGISVIWDTIAGGTGGVNQTPYTITDSQYNVFSEVYASNFNCGLSFWSGLDTLVEKCVIDSNPGTSATSSKGLGIWVLYQNGGNFSSVGHPVKRLTIRDCTVTNNGAVVSGYGVFIDASTSTSDIISDIKIIGGRINNNASAGLDVNGTSFIQNLLVKNVTFGGASQTTQIGNNVKTGMVTAALPGNALVTECGGYSPQGNVSLFKGLPGAIGAGNAVLNNYPFAVMISVVNTAAGTTGVHVIDAAGNDAQLGILAQNQPSMFIVPPGGQIYFTTSLPNGWTWWAVQ